MARPRLLLLDEPSLGLAPILVTMVFQLVAQLREGAEPDHPARRAERPPVAGGVRPRVHPARRPSGRGRDAGGAACRAGDARVPREPRPQRGQDRGRRRHVSASELVQQLVNGLSLGGTYALIALGLAMVFSIMGLINFAHGDLITIGGYVMWELTEPRHQLVRDGSGRRSSRRPGLGGDGARRVPSASRRQRDHAAHHLVRGQLLHRERLRHLHLAARPGDPGAAWLNEAVHFGPIIVPVVQVLTICVTPSASSCSR